MIWATSQLNCTVLFILLYCVVYIILCTVFITELCSVYTTVYTVLSTLQSSLLCSVGVALHLNSEIWTVKLDFFLKFFPNLQCREPCALCSIKQAVCCVQSHLFSLLSLHHEVCNVKFGKWSMTFKACSGGVCSEVRSSASVTFQPPGQAGRKAQETT